MGDMNDGPGMDYYEMQIGKSTEEITMRDLFYSDKILKNLAGHLKWLKYGWEPSTTRFYDRFTEDTVNAFIDHILVSWRINEAQNLFIIWNPFLFDEPKQFKKDLLTASDDFPLSLDIF